MEMNNLRAESHVAQKNRRNKLRYQQNTGDPNHQHPPISYNPNVFPSEMLTSISRNPQLLLPPVSHDQDSCPASGLGCSQPERILISSTSGGAFGNNLPYTQDNNCSNWNNVVSYSNAVSMNIVDHGYHQDYVHNNLPAFGSPIYHNNLQQDHVTLAQPPPSKNDSGLNSSIPCWMNTSDESGFLATRIHDHRDQPTATMAANGGLSLSLSSSVPQLKDGEPCLQSGQKPLKPDLLTHSDPKSFMGVSAFAHRNTGPLGPFTGYATILKNSKYMKPAQELLNDHCDVGYQELVQTCHDVYSQKILEEEISWASDCSVASFGGSDSGRNSSGSDSHRTEFHRKKAKLLHMQEEVCRRYKHYLQQMQMVISSFETVAGLSAATPYVCFALKAVSRHFHYVKDVISEKMRKILVGEGFCSSSTTGSKAAFDANATSTSRMKSIDQSVGKSGGGAAGFFASPQPVWRPQRGLPERAISVLKTWLFDHFLHPYPSDADKHMLATQTGLTRNQVSNWFINARVRIWKPMVEEIHSLETKGLAESNSTNHQPDGQDPTRMDMSLLSSSQPQDCSRNPGVTLTVDKPLDQLPDHEKLARPEYQIPLSNMDRLMSIMPYPQAAFDASGLGPVSLTLGLRQNAEHVQQLQQHFGGQLIHDFVG